jgi:hypothetical protein
MRIVCKRNRETKIEATFYFFIGAEFEGVQPSFYSLESFLHFAAQAWTGCGKNSLFCHSEGSEESLFDLTVRKQRRRDSSLPSE